MSHSSRNHRAYIAALWEYPELCVAVFGVQFHTDGALRLYQAAGIDAEVEAAVEAARAEGLLLNRPLVSPEGPLLLQYWRSFEDLDRWARRQPHARWWRWLVENEEQGIGFYHEIYRVKAGEAIFEAGTDPVGPALFTRTHQVKGGEGKSRERMERFGEGSDAT